MTEKIRVAIVDDVAQTRKDIRRLLSFEESIAVVGEAENGRQALEVVAQSRPDVVLMDINMPVMDGITATEALSRSHPHVAVIMVSIQGEQEYLKLAMMAGAREYLVKPLSSEEMVVTIHQVSRLNKLRGRAPSAGEKEKKKDSQNSKPAGISLVFFSGKGGCGKTTLACNLAALLAREKKKVVLLDLDLQFGDVAVMFNLQETHSIADLAALEEINGETLENFLVHHYCGVDILSAPFRPQQAESVGPEQVKAIIAHLRGSYDYILIDTPPAFNDVCLTVLEEANLILAPLVKEVTAVRAMKASLEIFASLQLLDRVRIILNEADRKTGVAVDDLERCLGVPVSHRLACADKALLQSVNRGRPLALEKHGGEAVRDMALLVRKIAKNFHAERSQAGKRGLARLLQGAR